LHTTWGESQLNAQMEKGTERLGLLAKLQTDKTESMQEGRKGWDRFKKV